MGLFTVKVTVREVSTVVYELEGVDAAGAEDAEETAMSQFPAGFDSNVTDHESEEVLSIEVEEGE
jgi:hypothetical protein